MFGRFLSSIHNVEAQDKPEGLWDGGHPEGFKNMAGVHSHHDVLLLLVPTSESRPFLE